MNIDSEVSALLSVAMNERCKTRKAAALALIDVLRTGDPTDAASRVAHVADQRQGGVGAEVLVLAKQFGLS